MQFHVSMPDEYCPRVYHVIGPRERLENVLDSMALRHTYDRRCGLYYVPQETVHTLQRLHEHIFQEPDVLLNYTRYDTAFLTMPYTATVGLFLLFRTPRADWDIAPDWTTSRTFTFDEREVQHLLSFFLYEYQGRGFSLGLRTPDEVYAFCLRKAHDELLLRALAPMQQKVCAALDNTTNYRRPQNYLTAVQRAWDMIA